MKQLRNIVDFKDIRRNESYHEKVPLFSFHLNDHTLGFHNKKLKIRRATFQLRVLPR